MMRLFILISLLFLNTSFSQDRSSEITCHPYREKGKIKGFSCPQLHEDSLLSKMGIQSRDQIIGYDGKTITSYKDMQIFYEKLHRKGKMTVNFKRGKNVYAVENTNK